MKSSFCHEIYNFWGIGVIFFSIYPKSHRCSESDITCSENIEFFREKGLQGHNCYERSDLEKRL